ncbi:phosphotransferase family protein [Promicromonospora vindobonensis]|uniref:Phosphotransferase family protein n=1 Tax=Promicromonospora vindobonensis TaxID=195748 RepID=A0ABW5VVP8_9MICO
MTDATRDDAGIGVLLGSGREAEVYARGNDAVVKLYRTGQHGHHAEALALTSLAGHRVAPGLVEVIDHDGRPGLVLERVIGTDMLDLLQRRPWRMRTLARALADAHVVVQGVRAPAELPDVRQVLATRIEAAAVPRELRGFALRLLDGLPSGDRLCHGDYHPGNVMVTADGVSVIDWPNAARGVPEADHARALLLMRWADPMPDAPLATRAVVAGGRSLLVRGYAHRYARAHRRQTQGRGSPARLQHLESWLVVHLAARLSEGIDAEQPLLTDLLGRARRKDHAVGGQRSSQ